jgi:hypothetical protein
VLAALKHLRIPWFGAGWSPSGSGLRFESCRGMSSRDVNRSQSSPLSILDPPQFSTDDLLFVVQEHLGGGTEITYRMRKTKLCRKQRK